CNIYVVQMCALTIFIAPIIGGIIYVLISLANIVLLEVVCETLAAMILMMVNFHYRKVSESHVDESQDSLLKMFLSGLNYIKKDERRVGKECGDVRARQRARRIK